MQRKILRILPLLFILSITICSQVWIDSASATPAKPGPIEVIQPNGVKFDAFMKGDEFQGWIEAANGYSIVENKDTGYWEYAEKDASGQLVPSGIIVPIDLTPPQGIQPHLKPDRIIPFEPEVPVGNAPYNYLLNKWTPHPEVGERKVIVVMVAFTDRALTTTSSTWHNIFFSTDAGVKSVANFYKDNSMNLVSIVPASHSQPSNPAGIVKVTLSRKHPNYGTNVGANYYTEVAWINEALALADDYVNFPSMDTDGSGTLEQDEVGIYFIVAGYEASGTYRTPSIGAHVYREAFGVTAGGMNLTRWGLNGELNHYNRNTAVGCPAHELGHLIFGLSDLYDVRGVNNGIGVFSVMSGGSWGQAYSDQDAGMTPTALDAWSRQYLGWANPRIPQEQGTVSFAPALSAVDTPVKLANPLVNTNEYFLIENRPTTGWDAGMYYSFYDTTPGGLLILHIDESIGDPLMNNINAYVSGSHQGVLVEEANITYGSLMDPASEYIWGYKEHLFYQENNASWIYNTTPNSNYYNGTYSNMGIMNVSAPASVMTATVIPCPPVATPSFSPDGGTYSSPQDVTISCSTSGATIRYTIDGSAPTESSTVYTGAIHIDKSLTLKAKAWLDGIPASGIRVATYTFTDPPPANVSITPDNATITSNQKTTLTSLFSDSAGNENIAKCAMLINSTLSATNAGYFFYDAASNKLYLRDANQSVMIGGYAPGANQVIDNGYIRLYCADTVIQRSGENLTIQWSIALSPSFGGKTCGAWMQVTNSTKLTDGWDRMGTYTISGVSPLNISITPDDGSIVPNQQTTLTSLFSDPAGNENITKCAMLINSTLSATNAGYFFYDVASNKLYLRDANQSIMIGGYAPGADQVIDNGYIRLYCADTVVEKSGNDLTIQWSIELSPSFGGKTCGAWMQVTNNLKLTDGWDRMGTYTIPAAPPVNTSLTPDSGSISANQKTVLTSVYSDSAGADNIIKCSLLINSTLTTVNAGNFYYDAKADKLYLRRADQAVLIGGYAPGTNQVIDNGYIRLYCADTVVQRSGNNLTIQWSIALYPSFAGKTCKAWMQVTNNAKLTDGWDQMGTFSIL